MYVSHILCVRMRCAEVGYSAIVGGGIVRPLLVSYLFLSLAGCNPENLYLLLSMPRRRGELARRRSSRLALLLAIVPLREPVGRHGDYSTLLR